MTDEIAAAFERLETKIETLTGIMHDLLMALGDDDDEPGCTLEGLPNGRSRTEGTPL